MTNYREILRLRSLGINHSRIAEGMGIARQTVVTTLQRAAAQELDWHAAESLSDGELAARLFPPGDGKPAFKALDYAAIHRELAKPGVTQQLLWMEYCELCRSAGETPYQLTQFKTHYREYVAKTKATMHINRKPGETMEVDWAGQPAYLVDTDTGESIEAPVFVAALPYSGYAYAEAFLRQDQAAWIAAHVKAFNHKPFQKKDGSRATWFAEERACLLPLPRNTYELAEWRIATVAFNYHIGVDERYYSVPYEYIKRKVDVRLTRHVVEVFFEGSRVCSHVRLYGRRGEYSTVEAHMPPGHQQYLQWSGSANGRLKSGPAPLVWRRAS